MGSIKADNLRRKRNRPPEGEPWVWHTRKFRNRTRGEHHRSIHVALSSALNWNGSPRGERERPFDLHG